MASPSARSSASGTAIRWSIGALCEISLDKLPDGRSRPHRDRPLDLLGEIFSADSGGGFFQRGVMNYPKIGSAVVPIGHDELRVIFDAAGPSTINVGHLQQDTSIGAYIDVDDMVQQAFRDLRLDRRRQVERRRADPARDHGRRGRTCASC